MLVGAETAARSLAESGSQLAGPVHQIMLVGTAFICLRTSGSTNWLRGGLRVRPHRRATQDSGRHRIDGGAGRDPVTASETSRAPPARGSRRRGQLPKPNPISKPTPKRPPVSTWSPATREWRRARFNSHTVYTRCLA